MFKYFLAVIATIATMQVNALDLEEVCEGLYNLKKAGTAQKQTMKNLYSFKDVWMPQVEAMTNGMDLSEVTITVCDGDDIVLDLSTYKTPARIQTTFVQGNSICALNNAIISASVAFMGEPISLEDYLGGAWAAMEATCVENWPLPQGMINAVFFVQDAATEVIAVLFVPISWISSGILSLFNF